MKGSVAILGQLQGRKIAAWMADGRLDDLFIDPPADSPLLMPGAICRGVAERPLKGAGGFGVSLPGGQRGYLRDAKGQAPGKPLLVQVSGVAEPGKSVPLTSRILFKGRFAIVTPQAPGINISRAIRRPEARAQLEELAGHLAADHPGLGLILRSATETAGIEVVEDEVAALIAIAGRIAAEAGGQGTEHLLDAPDAHERAYRDWPQPDSLADGPTAIADHGLNEALEAMASPRVDLGGGAHAFVEPTRALVAVDVNTGADLSVAAGLKANVALARDLPRQLRCRGLGGQIAIDFAPMARSGRQVVEDALRVAFRRDAVETALAGWTPLGHFELQRKRDRLPL